MWVLKVLWTRCKNKNNVMANRSGVLPREAKCLEFKAMCNLNTCHRSTISLSCYLIWTSQEWLDCVFHFWLPMQNVTEIIILVNWKTQRTIWQNNVKRLIIVFLLFPRNMGTPKSTLEQSDKQMSRSQYKLPQIVFCCLPGCMGAPKCNNHDSHAHDNAKTKTGFPRIMGKPK